MEFFTRVVTKPSILGNTILNVKPHQDLSKTVEKVTYSLWSFITYLIVIFTMKALLKSKTSWKT